jgi:hypothetical protein
MKLELPIQVQLPPQAVVRAMLQQCLDSLPEILPVDTSNGGNTPMQDRCALLPAIGAPLEDGIYAGITVHMDLPLALVLLPGEDKLPWAKAGNWAKAQGGILPSRFDALVLFKNLKKEFKEEWYWTSEEYAGYADFAWVQGFDYGDQSSDHKSDVCRCRAVRRAAI